jgi:hypothetical protein
LAVSVTQGSRNELVELNDISTFTILKYAFSKQLLVDDRENSGIFKPTIRGCLYERRDGTFAGTGR